MQNQLILQIQALSYTTHDFPCVEEAYNVVDCGGAHLRVAVNSLSLSLTFPANNSFQCNLKRILATKISRDPLARNTPLPGYDLTFLISAEQAMSAGAHNIVDRITKIISEFPGAL